MCVTNVHKVVMRVNKMFQQISVINTIKIWCEQLNIDSSISGECNETLTIIDYLHTHPESIC
jgi:hypothetical protein